ncbi:MAG: ABC transporter ATP-binding protein [Acidimicrobiia bacterium]
MSERAEVATSTALRRVLVVAPALRRGLGVTVGLAALGTAIQLVVPVVVQQIIDFELLAPSSVDVGGAMVRGGVALLAMGVAMYIRGLALVRLAVRTAEGLSQLRVKAFAHLHRLSVLHVESERRGTLVARVTSDIAAVQDFLDWGGVGMLVGSAQVVLALVAMAIYRWQLALLVGASALVYAAMLVWFQRILQRNHDRVRRSVGDSLAAMGEAISGMPTVRAYGAEKPALSKIEGVLDTQFRAEFRTMKLGAALFSSAELFAGLITAGVIGAGIALGPPTGLSAGTLIAFLFLVNLLVDPIQNLVETLDQAQSAASGIRRVLTVLDTPIEIPDPGDGGRPLPGGQLGLAFHGVSFSYPTGGDVLHDVTATVPSGSRVAIVGETGSGKSTFAKLATRLLEPRTGSVTVGGIPINDVAFAELRNRVAFVPQEGFLFDATIGDNVRYGKPGATDRELNAAFLELELDDWIASLPAGFDTEVGERGNQLSAGERQLVALVRAWIAAPDVLVLDEATSAVDPALEVRIRRAMERITRGRTSITVAHRLSTAEASDEILVFDQGVLVERGTHAELVARGRTYAGLHADWIAGTAAV